MKPRTALTLDIVCWLSLTLGLFYFGYNAAAVIVGLFASVYLWRCVRTMLLIIKAEQTLTLYEDYDERDFH